MSPDDVLRRFTERRAARGPFPPDLRAPQPDLPQCALVLQHPREAEARPSVGAAVAGRLAGAAPTVVLSPAIGGSSSATRWRALGVRAILPNAPTAS